MVQTPISAPEKPSNPPTLNESLESSSSSTSGLGGPDFLGSATSSMTNSSWQQCLSETWQMSRAFFGPKTEEWNGMGMRMRGGFRNNECHSRDFFIGFFCFQKKDKEGHVSVIISLCHEQNLRNMPLYRISIVVHTPVNQRTMGMHLFPLEHHLLELHLLSCWNFHPNAKYLESIKSTEKKSFSLFGCVSPKNSHMESFDFAKEPFLVLTVLTHLKNISQIGSFPQIGVKITNL